MSYHPVGAQERVRILRSLFFIDEEDLEDLDDEEG